MITRLLCIAALLSPAAAQDSDPGHVVLIVLGGGVRTKDTLKHEGNTLNLKRIAEAGVLMPSCKIEAKLPVAAQRAVMAGVLEEAPRERHLPGPHPTIGEILRKDGKLPASDVWFIVSGGGGETLLSTSDHAEYGPAYAPSTLAPDLVLSETLKEQLSEMGVSDPPTDADEAELIRLLGAIDTTRAGSATAADPGAAGRAAVARFMLEELLRTDTGKPGEGDARALRAASSILLRARPKFLCVMLRDAAVAARSHQIYEEVLKRNDLAIGTLWDAVQKHTQLADKTTFVVVSDHGRNRKVDAKGGLGYDDGSHDATRVALIFQGPRFKRKETIRIAVHTIDVVPTICHLFGIKAATAKGKVVRTALLK
ncbi:MAG: sulfatase-like hydrolase/transferase [Planctomycetes bacterium]|nr:sulfatase-like hydrolase/transferase [Planctomycetota bacterium]